MNYTKQRLQWLIDDYNGDGATTRDEANLAQLVLDLREALAKCKLTNEILNATIQDVY